MVIAGSQGSQNEIPPAARLKASGARPLAVLGAGSFRARCHEAGPLLKALARLLSCPSSRFRAVQRPWILQDLHGSSAPSLSRVQLFATPWAAHARPPCPSPAPGLHPDPRPSSQWCHPAIPSSVSPSSLALSLSQHPRPFKWVSFLHQAAKILEFKTDTYVILISALSGYLCLRVVIFLHGHRHSGLTARPAPLWPHLTNSVCVCDWMCSEPWKEWKCYSLSRVRLFATPWTAAHQAPLSMGFSRQEHWSG